MTELKPANGKRRKAIIISVCVIIVAAILMWMALRQHHLNPSSDDANIGASIVNVSSMVPGRIASINVKENARVRRGDVLFTIEPHLYQLGVDQARAELKMAEAAQTTQHRTVVAEKSNADITNAQIVRARTNLKLATQTLARLQPMLAKGYVTAQQVDDAATLKHDAEVSLQQALQQAVASDALVSTTEGSAALVEARRAALGIAERSLENTVIRAPNDGLVVGLKVSPGEFVIPDQAIFVLINSDSWYASAFFQETDLQNIQIGSCATVYTMTDKSKALKGNVSGIGWGITSENQISIPRNLPYVPKSLNWVRVAQRFPVRIELKDPPENLMRVGASAVVIVHDDTDC